MGLTARMKGVDVKEWYIKDTDNVTYNLLEMKDKIQKGEITFETMVYKPSKSIFVFTKKKWKKAAEYHELRTVLEKFPPQ